MSFPINRLERTVAHLAPVRNLAVQCFTLGGTDWMHQNHLNQYEYRSRTESNSLNMNALESIITKPYSQVIQDFLKEHRNTAETFTRIEIDYPTRKNAHIRMDGQELIAGLHKQPQNYMDSCPVLWLILKGEGFLQLKGEQKIPVGPGIFIEIPANNSILQVVSV